MARSSSADTFLPGIHSVGATRLSHDPDASTSIERQAEAITAYATAGRHSILKITEDVGVSGAVSPFDRPELAPWLDGNSGQWDALVVTKLDRLTRSLIDLETFVRWCKQHGKTLVSTSENIDLSTPTGKVFVQLLGIFAEFERTRMSERRAEAAAKLRSNGWHGGGQGIPDGYRAVKVDNHYELEIDPMPAALIEELARLITGGMSMRQACARFNDSGYRTAKGCRWDVASISRMLRNPALRGYTMHEGQAVAGEDGMPLQRTPVLGDDMWARLQAALDRLSKPDSGVRHEAALLLRVLYHGDDPLYMHRRPGRGDRYRTGPKVRKSASFRADVIEEIVTDTLLSTLGHLPMRRLEVTPAQDHTAELAKVMQRLSDLEAEYVDGNLSASLFARMTSRLESRHRELSAQPFSSNLPVQVFVRPGAR